MAAAYDDGLIPSVPPSDLEYVPPRAPLFSDKEAHYEVRRVEQPERTICGLRRITFLLLVLIAVLLIVGAVGGGVGGSLAGKNAQNVASKTTSIASAVTVTVTATSTLPTQSPVTAPVLSCPADNSTTYSAANGGRFTIICDENFPYSDLRAINDTATFDQCIENCAYFNRLKPSVQCIGVVFTPSENFCWLKSSFGASSETSNAWAAACIGCQQG